MLQIVQRHVKLRRAGSIWQGRCPFHQEKTPSFTVTEARGTYHCFGCGEHGNAIDFLMGIENLTFIEAVARASELSGIEAPAMGGAAAATPPPPPDRVEALEAAALWFRECLNGESGAEARAYLGKRGLDRATAEAFELGWAPAGRDRFTAKETARGRSLDALIEVGLSVRPDGHDDVIDRFRERLMFPIRDARGQLVGFGGRSLRSDAKAKYLNSPETPLFRKRELLYGADRLRSFARNAPVHVVEGYMDVIALARVGVAAVAPLGTAVTEEQLSGLWRYADVPVVCLDGDTAGKRAAFRLAELAVEHLRAGKSLGFVTLPENEDPDSLVQARGAEAFQSAAAKPVPLADMVWAGLVTETGTATPEARAQLKKRARALVKRIADGDVRSEYGASFAVRLDALSGRPGARSAGRGFAAAGGFGSRIGRESLTQADRMNDWRLLHPLIQYPAELSIFDEDVGRLQCVDPQMQALQANILSYFAEPGALETDKVISHLQRTGFGDLLQELFSRRVMEPLDVDGPVQLEDAYRQRIEQAAKRQRRAEDRVGLSAAASTGDPGDWPGERRAVDTDINADQEDRARHTGSKAG